MSFWDYFKKKAPILTPLEELFENASKDISLRQSFYQSLLDNRILALKLAPTRQVGERIASDGETIDFITLANGHIPLFTAQHRIFEGKVIKQQVNFIGLLGKDLFSFTKGATFVLNPFSKYSLELSPELIEEIMGEAK